MPVNQNYGTGRRKTSTARVFVTSGNGEIKVNERTLDQYFGRETARMVVRQPLRSSRRPIDSTYTSPSKVVAARARPARFVTALRERWCNTTKRCGSRCVAPDS